MRRPQMMREPDTGSFCSVRPHCSASCHIMGHYNNNWVKFSGKVDSFHVSRSLILSVVMSLEEILQISEKLNEIMKRSVFVNEIFRKYYDVSGSFLTLSCSFTKTNVIHRLWQGWRINFNDVFQILVITFATNTHEIFGISEKNEKDKKPLRYMYTIL